MLGQEEIFPNCKSRHKGLLLISPNVNSSLHRRIMSEKSDPKPEQGPSPIGEISQEPSAFEAFLDANQKRLLIIGILAVLSLIGYVIVTGLQKRARQDAAAAVAAGRTVPDYEALSKAYDGEVAGGTALLLKAQLLWSDQQQQEAITAVKDFISKYPEHPSFGDAHTTLGSYLQQVDQLEAAKEAFTTSAETKSATSSIALLSLGDIALQAGESQKAKEYYDRIITDYENTHPQVKGFAQERIKLIGVKPPVDKAPELPKTITPPGAGNLPANFPGFKPVQPSPTPTPTPTTPTPTPTTLPVTPPAPEPAATTAPETAPEAETDGATTEELLDLPELDVPEETEPPAATGTPPE